MGHLTYDHGSSGGGATALVRCDMETVMADVECGKFELLKQAPAPGMLTFRARLKPAPSALWRTVFDRYQGMECAASNPAVARIRSDVMEFSVADSSAQAAVAAIRRCIEKTNVDLAGRAAGYPAAGPECSEETMCEWRGVEEKYREGL